MVKESTCNVGGTKYSGSIPGSRRSLGVGNSNPLQYFCLENSMNRGSWRATVHGSESDMTEWLGTHTHNSNTKKKYHDANYVFLLCV